MDYLVLIIDEEEIERRYIATVLASDGFDVIQAPSVVEGMVQAMSHDPALIIIAEETSPVSMEETIALIRRLTRAPVMVVGQGDGAGEVASLESGGDYYLARPFRGAELAARARQLIQRSGSGTFEALPQLPRQGLAVAGARPSPTEQRRGRAA